MVRDVVQRYGELAADEGRHVFTVTAPEALVITGDGRSRCFVSFADPATPLVLTALRAGPGGTLVVRLANPNREEAAGTLRFEKPIRASRPVDLREGDDALGNTGLELVRTAAPLVVHGEVADAKLQPYEIGTWIVQLA